MANQYNFNTIFMGLMLVLGLVLIYISWDTDSKLLNCNKNGLKNTNKLVLILGTALASFSIAYFRCSMECETKDFGLITYLVTTLILGFALIVLGAIISSKSTGECQNLGSFNLIWILGIIMVVMVGIVFYVNREDLCTGKSC